MLLKNFAFCWGAFGPTPMNWPKHSVHIGKTSFFLNFCHRMFLTPTSWNYLSTYMSCIYVALLLFKTSDLIYHKTAFNQGKVTQNSKSVVGSDSAALTVTNTVSLSPTTRLRHLEFHFKFEKNPSIFDGSLSNVKQSK